MTFYDATQLAHDANAGVSLDDDALNPDFRYVDDDGRKHVVWFLDAATLFNQIKVATPTGRWATPCGGWAPKTRGLELPAATLWRGQAGRPGDHRSPVRAVDFDGTGEVLHVDASPTAGRRSIEIDPDDRPDLRRDYQVMPTSVRDQTAMAAHPGWVALTFDDGPDGRWTPKILDILKAKHAPATFFVIGENMQARPDLVQREVARGPHGGQPHLDPSQHRRHRRSPRPTWRSTPPSGCSRCSPAARCGSSGRPIFGDAEPSTPGEVEPLLVAQNLGYLIVGPADRPRRLAEAAARADHQADAGAAEADAASTAGQVVLLHDAGGDRSRTVEALPDSDRRPARRGLPPGHASTSWPA